MQHRTNAGEACAYVGVIPLIFAGAGLTAPRGDRSLTLWRLIIPVSLALATMADWWPDGYFAIVQLPGLGWFRAPARYTLLTSLGLALMAGRGLNHSLSVRRFGLGLLLAITFGIAAWGWSIHCARAPNFQVAFQADTLSTRFGAAGLVWVLALITITGWRQRRLSGWVPLSVAVVELAGLFFAGPIRWGWTDISAAGPLLRRLATEPGVGLVSGRLANLPVDVGQATAYPTLGISAPPPNYLLEPAMIYPPGKTRWSDLCWQRRFGVTHGVWGTNDDVQGTEILAEVADPIVDRLLATMPALRTHGPWKLVRNSEVFPSAWVARHIREAPDWPTLYSKLTRQPGIPDEAWFLGEDHPFPIHEPIARLARVLSWDGQTAVVEHDGSCILVLRRTYYPGWFYRVNGGPVQAMRKVDGGLQAVQLVGSATSRVSMYYWPTGLAGAAWTTTTAVAAALLVLVIAGLQAFRRSPQSS